MWLKSYVDLIFKSIGVVTVEVATDLTSNSLWENKSK